MRCVMSVAALDQVLTESQVPQRPLNGATIEVGSALSETTAAGALFSKNLTESQFFERYPEWKGKLTLAHKALVELTGKVLEANSHPMNRAVHDFISWAAAIYSADQKIPQREIQLMFEGLDGHLQTIKEAAPSNVDAVVFKAMQTIRSLWREME